MDDQGPSSPSRAEVVLLVARLTAQEALRRRAVAGIAIASAFLLALFGLAADQGIAVAREGTGTIDVDYVGATLLGTAAFTDLLLGAFVAVFLAHGAVRGDAERGLLQPLLVRPVSRGAVVLGRVAAAAVISSGYALAMWLAAVVLLRVLGGWSVGEWLEPGAAIAAGVALVAVTAVTASTFLSAQATGVVTLILVGMGFTVGLLAQLGDALDIRVLQVVADVVSWALPFEALYRHALFILSGGLGDLAAIGLAVGPFGGAREGSLELVGWIVLWVLAMAWIARWRTNTLDL